MKEGTIQPGRESQLIVGHDVWVGDRVTILPRCRNIGNGSVLAAGSVVTKNVPAYTKIGGVPARVLGMRFEQDAIIKLEKTTWCEKPVEEIQAYEDQLLNELTTVNLAQLKQSNEA